MTAYSAEKTMDAQTAMAGFNPRTDLLRGWQILDFTHWI